MHVSSLFPSTWRSAWPQLLIALAALFFCALSTVPTNAQETELTLGKQVFAEKARCLFCHAWDGSGDNSEYGGVAPSLRATQLTADQIAETVRCGRPGKGMPYHDRDAYLDGRCYGLKKADIGSDLPPMPFAFLNDKEIQAVAAYVTTELKGKGPADYAECTSFFGSTSHVCNRYKTQ